jgi:hypothetical protein
MVQLKKASLRARIWGLVGGIGREEAKVMKMADPDVRKQIARVIFQARDKDAEAADHIARALAKQTVDD